MWAAEAARCLEEIRDFLAERSPRAAANTLAGIYRLAGSLDHLPERGFRYRTRTGREVRVVLFGHYRVVYRVEPNGDIVILGIFHGAMDLARHLR
jgi:plasmid stabilization system protein ParE